MNWTPESARAALALGPVEFQCVVCGARHRSDAVDPLPPDALAHECAVFRMREGLVSFARRILETQVPLSYSRLRIAVHCAYDYGRDVADRDDRSCGWRLTQAAWSLIECFCDAPGAICSSGMTVTHESVFCDVAPWIVHSLRGTGGFSWLLMAPESDVNAECARLICAAMSDPCGWRRRLGARSAELVNCCSFNPALAREITDATQAFQHELDVLREAMC